MSAQIEFLPVRYEEPLELDFETPPESPTLPLIGEPPAVGYATWTTPNVDELKSGLRAALDAGYRFIDTAGYFEEEQAAVGDVLHGEYVESGRLKRADVFLSGKVPIHAHRPDLAERWIERSLRNLRTDYLDLFVLHFPLNTMYERKIANDSSDFNDALPHLETYRVLERHVRRGHFRSLGVANLNAAQLLQLWTAAEIKPTCLQLELHSLHPPADLVEVCERLGVRITASAPFGHSSGSSSGTQSPQSRCLSHPILSGLAERHAKTASQLLIRQLLQRGVGVLPLSTRPERVFENADVFDFELDDEEMGQFDVMNKELQQPCDLLQIQGPRFIRNDVLYFTILRSLYCGT
ncbi:Aldo-ket-red domain-containing protein [Aphelenchoides fujianensis]|nr:Aldo-ket-red domain-containing protein [Aphelenchoides fujianensis]